MNKRFMGAVVLVAVTFMVAVVAIYMRTFGTIRSLEYAVWGAFGDYFGGILNPIFALCAFVGVLWSLDMQTKQLNQLSVDKQGEEIVVVVKDIDSRIRELLATPVGGTDQDKLFLHHMVSESERGAGIRGTSKAYAQFLSTSRLPGSIIEALTRELRNQVITMHSFLVRYPQGQAGQYAPVVDYYKGKTKRIVPMINEINKLPETVFEFFINGESSNKPAYTI
jgi:uncharacterized membrane protein